MAEYSVIKLDQFSSTPTTEQGEYSIIGLDQSGQYTALLLQSECASIVEHIVAGPHPPRAMSEQASE